MKKLLAIILSGVMLLTFAACGGAGSAEGTAASTTEASKQFMVGYARENITPSTPIGLDGYGNTEERKHTEVLDYIYLTCVAMTDTEDNTVLFYSADLCYDNDVSTGVTRAKVSDVTGIPADKIMINQSHSHSAPRGTDLGPALQDAAVKAAEDALADRKPATMYAGKAETDGISFVRHYYMDDGSVVTDNHGSTEGKVCVSHITEVDEEMRVLCFKRDGGKDVVLANWQCHPHLTGGMEKTTLSADIVGAFRMNIEEKYDCLFAYYQGGAGNINPTSRITEENVNQERNYKVHGQLLAQTCMEAINNSVELQTGPIKHIQEIYTCDTNQEEMEMASTAVDVISYYNAGHSITETKAYAQSVGLQSLFHARAIANRGSLGQTLPIEINAFVIGDFGWTMAPFEMFDATAKSIRESSPCAFTFSCGYSNGDFGYFPTLECWEYGAYEVDTTKVAPGTAEGVAERLVELLNQLHG